MYYSAMTDGGTGQKLAHATIIVAGVASLLATLLSLVSVWLQLKNYRKPLLQRYVVRILLMVPIYAISSWCSLISLNTAFYVDPIRDIYEALTIYTFVQLLINFIGGERALIIMMHGREPVRHLWPLNYFLPKVDISDPHTFLAIKRGILQYAWLKPVLGLATIIMKSTGVYQEGFISLTSGYLWSGIAYNISVTLSLYSLGMFWVCMSKDLRPFRPVPKFLCIKLIIFASYWQGFTLSILVWLKAIPDDVDRYTPDNLAAAIQDALICCEMPIFAIAHWYAFSWQDYADATISAARLPVRYAVRDAFGIRDLIEDTKETFSGNNYEYRQFDSGDNVLAHEESSSRVARMMQGMRYERGGKGKYWIPKPGEVNSRTPLLSQNGRANQQGLSYGDGAMEETDIDQDEEMLYAKARSLPYGDWNYPVIMANEPSREGWITRQTNRPTTPSNRNPTRDERACRKTNIENTAPRVQNKGKNREISNENHTPMLKGIPSHESPGSSSFKLDRSRRIGLVENEVSEEIERVHGGRNDSIDWTRVDSEVFVTSKGKETEERLRPSDSVAVEYPKGREPIIKEQGEQKEMESPDVEDTKQWKQASDSEALFKRRYEVEDEAFKNVWDSSVSSEPPRDNP